MFAQMSMLNARDSEQQDKVAAAKAEREAKKQQKMEQMRAMMAAPAPAPLPDVPPHIEGLREMRVWAEADLAGVNHAFGAVLLARVRADLAQAHL